MSLLFSNVPCDPNPSLPVMPCTNVKPFKFVTPQWNNNNIEDKLRNILEHDTNVATQQLI